MVLKNVYLSWAIKKDVIRFKALNKDVEISQFGKKLKEYLRHKGHKDVRICDVKRWIKLHAWIMPEKFVPILVEEVTEELSNSNTSNKSAKTAPRRSTRTTKPVIPQQKDIDACLEDSDDSDDDDDDDDDEVNFEDDDKDDDDSDEDYDEVDEDGYDGDTDAAKDNKTTKNKVQFSSKGRPYKMIEKKKGKLICKSPDVLKSKQLKAIDQMHKATNPQKTVKNEDATIKGLLAAKNLQHNVNNVANFPTPVKESSMSPPFIQQERVPTSMGNTEKKPGKDATIEELRTAKNPQPNVIDITMDDLCAPKNPTPAKESSSSPPFIQQERVPTSIANKERKTHQVIKPIPIKARPSVLVLNPQLNGIDKSLTFTLPNLPNIINLPAAGRNLFPKSSSAFYQAPIVPPPGNLNINPIGPYEILAQSNAAFPQPPINGNYAAGPRPPLNIFDFGFQPLQAMRQFDCLPQEHANPAMASQQLVEKLLNTLPMLTEDEITKELLEIQMEQESRLTGQQTQTSPQSY